MLLYLRLFKDSKKDVPVCVFAMSKSLMSFCVGWGDREREKRQIFGWIRCCRCLQGFITDTSSGHISTAHNRKATALLHDKTLVFSPLLHTMSSAFYSFISSITNTLTSKYDIKHQISSAGLWKIYQGERKTTGKKVALFVCSHSRCSRLVD